MQKSNLSIVLVAFLAVSFSFAQTSKQLRDPQRVIVNLTDKPATSMAVTWRTLLESSDQFVEYAASTDGVQFEKLVTRIPARCEQLDADKQGTVYHYSAVLDGLEPGARYVYRVGGDSVWSEWNQFTTARTTPAPFTFVWFGDPQEGIKEHVSRVFREAFKTAPDAAFWTFSGDMASEPEDYRFGELFYAAGFVFRMVPSIMTPGNHDMAYKMENGKIVLDAKGRKERGNSVSTLWRAHFTLPENGLKGFEEASYSIDYQGVRVILVNSNDRLEEQAAWLEKLLADNPNTWTIVSFHHPLYSFGRTRDERMTRNAFLPLFDKYHVDLVLTGHDHTYARSYKLNNGSIAPKGGAGTVYVVSSSGPKTYVANPLYAALMAKTAVDMSLFQVIAVEGNKLTVNVHSATGSIIDSFQLEK